MYSVCASLQEASSGPATLETMTKSPSNAEICAKLIAVLEEQQNDQGKNSITSASTTSTPPLEESLKASTTDESSGVVTPDGITAADVGAMNGKCPENRSQAEAEEESIETASETSTFNSESFTFYLYKRKGSKEISAFDRKALLNVHVAQSGITVRLDKPPKKKLASKIKQFFGAHKKLLYSAECPVKEILYENVSLDDFSVDRVNNGVKQGTVFNYCMSGYKTMTDALYLMQAFP